MTDQKSKFPDFNEITSMAGKLFNDVKNSITEIIEDYKTKHPKSAVSTTEKSTTTETIIETKIEPKATKEDIKETKTKIVEEIKKAKDTTDPKK